MQRGHYVWPLLAVNVLTDTTIARRDYDGSIISLHHSRLHP